MHQRPDDVSREDFLKTVGALSLVGAGIVPATQVVVVAAVSPGPETITSASHFGIFQATVANSAIAHFAPHPSDPHAPEMLPGLADLVYSPSRVKYPMVRRGFLKNGHLSDTAERGNGDFVRVSWDEALSLVASEIKRIKKTYGNSALYAGSYGWQSAGQMHNAFTLLHRFYNGVGGYVGDIGDYSTAAA
ncbi:MAG TPA: molybdopterin-dependent oxidoreductase, partial [Chloroflexota bacterium]|nr:molybdopterin-dependent oxidoreductase [Chloroflexota bacterium]